MSCVCNPWMYFLNHWKINNAVNLPENISNKLYLHGMLMFDPKYGFVIPPSENSAYTQFWDTIIWFLNLAYMYHCANQKNMINEIDFRMHYHLWSNKQEKLEKKYDVKANYWNIVQEESKQAQYKNLPHWFTYVVKWFVHGVNGPFGTVSKVSHTYIQHFYQNNPNIAQVV